MSDYKIYTPAGKTIRVLIVDDSKFIHILLKKVFDQMDIEVAGTAEDGIEGIQKYEKLKPDFVTLDITMPKLNGLNALIKIKDIDPKAKVIMISSFGPDKILKECIFKGALNFIQKPFSVEEAIKKIYSILKKAYDEI